MTGQMIFLGMVVAAFATFMGVLGAVTAWTRLGRGRQQGA